MAIITGVDCTATRFGTGMEVCQAIEGLPKGFILTPKGWQLSKSSGTFNKAYVEDQIQLGNFIPFTNAFDVVSETPDATTQESQSGIMEVVRQGKPTITATFKKGLAFQKASFTYNTFEQYDVLLTYETGMIKAVETVDGTAIKALSVGMFNTNGYSENNGTNSASTIVKFQITDPFEYNQYSVLLTNLDFNPNTELNGITDVVLTGTADASDNKVYVKAVWKHNESFDLSIFSSANFRLTVNGVANTIVSATWNTLTKQYEITPTVAITAGQSCVVQLYDATVPVATAQVVNKFYKGTTPAIVVVA
jgi:hypothetical protein